MPAEWAATQNNLAMALKALGRLHNNKALLKEARAAVLRALNVLPEQEEIKDTLKQIDEVIAALFRLEVEAS